MRRLGVPVGTRFGRLTVVGEAEPDIAASGKAVRRMKCQCDCGATATVLLGNLKAGRTTSCGCYNLEMVAARSTTHGQTVGGSVSKNYRIWAGIKQRAVTGSSHARKDYLDRGISMYEPWQSDFIAFDTWLNEHLGPCPKGLTLDRISNDGNYEPGNLKWSTPPEQGNNKRNNVWIEYGGQKHTLAQWARLLGMKEATLSHRLFKANWPVEKALTTPVRWY